MILEQGGSTLFKGFGKRLVEARLGNQQTGSLDVCVHSHSMHKHAAWLGGSLLGSLPSFATVCHSRADYEEHGSGIRRSNAVFSDL